jgi:hypothetical protein
MEKQTATEWLFDKLLDEPKDKFTWNTILMQAKEMEKQQIKKAFLKNDNSISITDALENFEQYYNDTFKQN